MSEGQWIESGTLDLWESRHREQLARIEELEAKLAKAVEVEKAQQLMNYYAVEIAAYGATISRLRNLEDAWTNLKTQTTLAELKGQGDE